MRRRWRLGTMIEMQEKLGGKPFSTVGSLQTMNLTSDNDIVSCHRSFLHGLRIENSMGMEMNAHDLSSSLHRLQHVEIVVWEPWC